jgi:type IV secretion system protein VirD4
MKISTVKIKKAVLSNLPYVFLFWFFDKVGESYRTEPGSDTLRKLMGCIIALDSSLSRPVPSFAPFDLLTGLTGAVIIYCIVLYS